WCLRQLVAIGLLDVEDVQRAEAHDALAGIVSRVLVLPCLLVLHAAHDRSEDCDPMLTLADLAAHRLPCLIPRHLGCVGTLERDQHDVSKAVVVKPCARLEPRCPLIGRNQRVDRCCEPLTSDVSSVASCHRELLSPWWPRSRAAPTAPGAFRLSDHTTIA